MSTQSGRRLVGAILAGGLSTRMGRAKAGERWLGDQRMGDAVLTALEANCDQVVVLGHGEGLAHRSDLDRLPDERADCGPLAGIESLLSSGLADRYLVCSCDMPLLTTELLGALLEGPDAPVVVLDGAGNTIDPFPLRIDSEQLEPLRSWLDAGGRGVRAFLASTVHHRLAIDEDRMAELTNVNTRDDLAEARAAANRELAVERDLASACQATHWPDRGPHADDVVAREEPLEIQLGSTALAVVMRTPGHDIELTTGFMVTERVISNRDDIRSIRHCTVSPDPEAEDNVVRVRLRDGIEVDLEALRRNLYASSSCGVCGKASIENAMSCAGPLDDASRVDGSWLTGLPDRLRATQVGFDATGGLHAAALFEAGGEMLVAREDVGRHNAVDKVIGWALRDDRAPLSGHVLMVSGRVSFEIVQKALAARIPIIAAVSAPTSLAVRLASDSNITLVGFLRAKCFNIYGSQGRITD